VKEKGSQFDMIYFPPEMGSPSHSIRVPLGENELGQSRSAMMSWNSKGITGIEVPPDHQRKGIASAMWAEGHRLAETERGIPAPKHSSDRTDAGDAWARSVGGRLPRRKQ